MFTNKHYEFEILIDWESCRQFRIDTADECYRQRFEAVLENRKDFLRILTFKRIIISSSGDRPQTKKLNRSRSTIKKGMRRRVNKK